METRFAHFNAELTNGKEAAITAAYKVMDDPIDNKLMIKVGYAFCSPKEKHFSKREGRNHAEVRLELEPTTIEFNGLYHISKEFIHELIKETGYFKGLNYGIGWMRKIEEIYSR